MNEYIQRCCSICLTDKKDCLPVTYPHIQEVCKKFNLKDVAFAVCQKCFDTTDRAELQLSLSDFFMTQELYKWTAGGKDGVIRTENEYWAFLEVLEEQGVIYRETKRMRKRFSPKINFLDTIINRSEQRDYKPDILYRNIFKSLYNEMN